MRTLIFYKLILGLYFTVNISCSRLVEVESPSNVIATDDIFDSKIGFESAIAGVYNQLMTYQSIGGGGLSSYISLASDDLVPTATSAVFQNFYNNSLVSSTSILNTFWLNAYKTIYRCNLILENIDSNNLMEEERNLLRIKAIFIRSFCYYHLVQLFGDVPLILQTDYRMNATVPRTSIQTVIDQIIADLESVNSKASRIFTSNRDHPNYYAINILLGKVYMLNKQYLNVQIICDEFYNDNNLQLESDLNKVFVKESKETIFQLSSTTSVVAEASLFLPYTNTTKALFILSDELLNSFENNDKRLSHWINRQEISGDSYHYPYKYKNLSTIPSPEFCVVFRLADVYLMDAESSLEINDIKRAEIYLNKIRERAGLSLLSQLTEGEAREEIKRQRQLEFFAEWGNRWYDLKRWGIIDDVLEEIKPSWKTFSKLLPVPEIELKSNVFLVQNEGYDD